MEFKAAIYGKIQDFEYWHKRFDENIGTHSHQSSSFGVYIKFTIPLPGNKQTYTPSHSKAKRD